MRSRSKWNLFPRVKESVGGKELRKSYPSHQGGGGNVEETAGAKASYQPSQRATKPRSTRRDFQSKKTTINRKLLLGYQAGGGGGFWKQGL